MSGLPRFQALLALLLVAAVGYVAVRGLLAQRRGDDVSRATAGALRAVGPPLFLAVVGIVVLSILAPLAVIVLIFVLLAGVADAWDTGANVLLVWLLGMTLVFLVVVGAVVWGLIRVVRNRG